MAPMEQTKFTNHNTSEELWNAVKEKYGKESVQGTLFYEPNLISCARTRAESIQTYLDQIRED